MKNLEDAILLSDEKSPIGSIYATLEYNRGIDKTLNDISSNNFKTKQYQSSGRIWRVSNTHIISRADKILGYSSFN